ncbi:MAG: hypothetical protein HY000_38935 [Planctomycetes bacterium]|nr:hypothetical protein [Planctomycetota bacterium]
MLQRTVSPALQRWVERYARVGRRNPYLWTWVRQAVEVTTLPCVRADLRDELCDTKALGVMFDVMLDDVADRGGGSALLEALLLLPLGVAAPDLSQFSMDQQAYAELACALWGEIQARARRCPCFEAYADLLRYDYLQLCNVMRYSHLLNRNLLMLNLAEHDLYTPHNMHIMICATLDLMCAPAFDRSELGKLREVVWHAQCMGRIGNLVTTWQRELGEGDFTSGVYARAVSCGEITAADLRAGDSTRIEAVILEGGHEAYFWGRWAKHRRLLLSRGRSLRSFDVRKFLAGFERLICLHLGSRGYK